MGEHTKISKSTIVAMKRKLRLWLTLEYCEDIFNTFKKDLEFDQKIPPFSERQPGSLESILGSVRQSFGGKYLNSSIQGAATSYFCQLVTGHSLKNGNKRFAVLYTHIFLILNGYKLNIPWYTMKDLALYLTELRNEGVPYTSIKRGCIKIFRDHIETFTPKK